MIIFGLSAFPSRKSAVRFLSHSFLLSGPALKLPHTRNAAKTRELPRNVGNLREGKLGREETCVPQIGQNLSSPLTLSSVSKLIVPSDVLFQKDNSVSAPAAELLSHTFPQKQESKSTVLHSGRPCCRGYRMRPVTRKLLSSTGGRRVRWRKELP